MLTHNNRVRANHINSPTPPISRRQRNNIHIRPTKLKGRPRLHTSRPINLFHNRILRPRHNKLVNRHLSMHHSTRCHGNPKVSPHTRLPRPVNTLARLNNIRLTHFHNNTVSRVNGPSTTISRRTLVTGTRTMANIRLPQHRPQNRGQQPRSITKVNRKYISHNHPWPKISTRSGRFKIQTTSIISHTISRANRLNTLQPPTFRQEVSGVTRKFRNDHTPLATIYNMNSDYQ